MTPTRHTYGKLDKLKSRKLIEELYEKGKTMRAYPLRARYMLIKGPSDSPLKVGVSVSKRNFKRAVDRNRIKRLMRESYRLNNSKLKAAVSDSDHCLAIMIMYGDNTIPNYSYVERKMQHLLEKITKEVPSSMQ